MVSRQLEPLAHLHGNESIEGSIKFQYETTPDLFHPAY